MKWSYNYHIPFKVIHFKPTFSIVKQIKDPNEVVLQNGSNNIKLSWMYRRENSIIGKVTARIMWIVFIYCLSIGVQYLLLG